MRISKFWWPVFLLVTMVAFFVYQQLQPVVSYDFVPQFDGNDYRMIYHYFTGTADEFEVPFPFHQRILVPFLASLINQEIVSDFQWVNFSFSLASVFSLFFLWRSLGFSLPWFFAGLLWLLFHWTGLIRLNAFDPITVDVPIYFFQTLFLLFVLKRKFIHLLWLAPLAVVQKESFIALMLVLWVYALWHNHRQQDHFYSMPLLTIALLFAFCAKLAVGFYFPPSTPEKSALITIGYHLKQIIVQPDKGLRWLAAMSMAFGPLLWLTLVKYGKHWYYENTRNLLVLFSGVYIAFGLLAGGDMTRIMFLGFPFLATWLMYENRYMAKPMLMWIGICSLPLMFLHQQIPDPAFHWQLWQSFYPEFASINLVLIALAYTLASAGGLYYFTLRRKG